MKLFLFLIIFSASFDALVIKASGLAAGKGVVVASSKDEACKAVDDMLGKRIFGSAGDTIVIEEKLIGEEVSILAFVDEKNIKVMIPTQDHKRLRDGDAGKNKTDNLLSRQCISTSFFII